MKTMKMLGVTWLFVLFGWCAGVGIALGGPIIYNKSGALGPDYPDLWTVNPDGTGNSRVPVSPEIVWGAEDPAWSRDGKHVAVTGVIGGETRTATSGPPDDLVAVNQIQTGAAKVLAVFDPAAMNVVVPIGSNTPTTYYRMFKAFSPDGRKVAYANVQLNFAEFGVVDLNSGTPTTFSQLPGATILAYPNVTAVGFADNTAGFSGFGIDWNPTPNSNVLVVSSSGLAYSSCTPYNPWNPSVPVSVTRLNLVPAVQNGLAQAAPLTFPPVSCLTQVFDLFPAFSDDGTQVAFVRLIEDQSRLVGTPTVSSVRVIPATGGGEREGIRLPQEIVGRVSWSPDGKQLIFDRTKLDLNLNPVVELGIWKINLDGSGLIPFEGAPANAATWSAIAR